MKRTKIQRGALHRGPASLAGTSRHRYAASKKLAEEAKEATKQVVNKVNKTKKQGDVVEINPEKDILGNGLQQQSS
jgi:hypothetical protein